MKLPPHFDHRVVDGQIQLCIEAVATVDLAARFGTPLYVYSKAALVENFQAYANAANAARDSWAPDGALICYAVKANSNLAILNLFARLGAGFDIVSGGELQRVLAAGGDPAKTIFSGVGKSRDEMRLALDSGILCFNVESISELHRLNEVAASMGKRAPVSLRVNPDVDPKTHPYISTGLKENKFGVAFDDARAAYRVAAELPHLRVIGIDCHIGSQLLDDAPLLEALDKLIGLIDTLADGGIVLEHLDLGGGIGIAYGDEEPGVTPVLVGDYLRRVFARIHAWRAGRYGGKPIQLLFEPGRSLAGNAGALLTKVEYLKPGTSKNFAIVDAAMNDLMRPAMYEAWHGVVSCIEKSGDQKIWEVVGPICESGDWLARQRTLSLAEGDVLAFLSAGAYGMTMSSNYNTRPRAAEVMVDGAAMDLIRERERIEHLLKGETLLP